MVYFNDLNENSQALHDLKQGKELINRQRNLIMDEIDKFKNFETFTNTKKIDRISVKENHVLGDMEDEYNKLISDYGTKYATFMRKYAKLSGDVDRCAAECLNIHPTTAANYSKRRKACVAGCELKGPYILQCKDTFTKDRDGKRCPQIVGDNCINGKTINHQQMIDKRDVRGRTARSGCCECGGGAGGNSNSGNSYGSAGGGSGYYNTGRVTGGSTVNSGGSGWSTNKPGSIAGGVVGDNTAGQNGYCIFRY